MITYFVVDTKTNNSTLEVFSDGADKELLNYITYDEDLVLPSNLKFRLKKGRRPTDVISYIDKEKILFFSQKFIDFLSKFTNMSHKCYPITVEGCDVKYFGLRNLRGFYHFNQVEHTTQNEPILFYDKDNNVPAVFTLMGIPMLIVGEQIQGLSYGQGFTNVDIEKRVFSYSSIEIEGWKVNWGKTD